MKKKIPYYERFVDKIVRNKIYDYPFYKEKCFGLNAESVIDRSAELECVGGTYGGIRKPTKFLCLLFKMLQINISKEIAREFIKNEHYKYLTVLGCAYFRLVAKPKEIYLTLEPLLLDYRKIRVRGKDGKFIVRHVDEIVEDLLRKKYYFDLSLPFLPKRMILEDNGSLERRVSPIEEFVDPKELDVRGMDDENNENFALKFKKSIEEQVEEELEEMKSGKTQSSGSGEVSMSIDDTNELRKKLGLKPLEDE